MAILFDPKQPNYTKAVPKKVQEITHIRCIFSTLTFKKVSYSALQQLSHLIKIWGKIRRHDKSGSAMRKFGWVGGAGKKLYYHYP